MHEAFQELTHQYPMLGWYLSGIFLVLWFSYEMVARWWTRRNRKGDM